MTKKTEYVSEPGIHKKKFKIHYDYKDRYVYVINGVDCYTNLPLSSCRKFDLSNQKWISMPDSKLKCSSPGSVISRDG